MRKRIIPLALASIVLLVILALPLTARVHAATDWIVTLTARLGTYKSVTVLGVANDATNSFDTAYDRVAPPYPLKGVYSYFWYPTNPSSPADLRALSTSIIPSSTNMNWNLSLMAVGLDGSMLLNWTRIPPQYNAYIMDSAGTVLADMTETSEYSYSASMNVTITFKINFVIPDLPIGPVLALAVCFASYGVYKTIRRH